jgi:formate dehydrogenase iron-sulfur subunit
MGKYAALVDVSRCTACRACQVACKQWNEKASEKTTQEGTYQNPPDLSHLTYTIIRFKEQVVKGEVVWNFFKDQCRHCLMPPCKEAADMMVEGAVLQDENGAVIFTEKTKQCDFEEVRDACPYDIPRKDPATGILYKCTFCNDRIANGMIPACIKVCPTGALSFGDREEMLREAQDRLGELKKRYPAARIIDQDEVSWIYILHQPESQFQISRKERKPSALYALKSLLRPIGIFAMGAALVSQAVKGRQ